MSKGISIFLGMQYSLKENLEFMNFAKEKGFNNIFTSLHIPEANYNDIVDEFKILVTEAKKLNMNIIADISPKGFEFLNISLNDLNAVKDLGVDVLRIDFGFTAEEISQFTKNPHGIKIEINGSTLTERFLKEFEKYNPNHKNIQACHNYYPRLNTGISIKSFLKKNEMMKRYGIKISAFIPSLINKRGPIYEGLPTLEIHRNIKPELSAKHLFTLGVDNVFFGDSIPAKEELEAVGNLKEDVLELKIKTLVEGDFEKKILFRDFYTNRSDSAEDTIRASESRISIGDSIIKPTNTIDRKKGFITLDNEGYLRYMGELQICKKELPRDERVNVIAVVEEEELFLLDYIEDEIRFKFKEIF